MPSAKLTHQDLETLLDGVAREARQSLQLKPTSHFAREHEEFCRRLAERLSIALDVAGYAWARRPNGSDELYKVLVEATSSSGAINRIGLASEDPGVSAFSRHQIADQMMKSLEYSGTVVVKRKRD